MVATTVERLGRVVTAALRAAGYEESTIGQYQETIKALTEFAADRGEGYMPELGAEFAAMTTSPRTDRFSAERRFDYNRLVGVFDSTCAPERWACPRAPVAGRAPSGMRGVHQARA